MSAALRKHGGAQSPPKKIVYYIDHGNPTSPQRLHNPQQYFVQEALDKEMATSDISKLAVTPAQLGWTWAAEECHMMVCLLCCGLSCACTVPC